MSRSRIERKLRDVSSELKKLREDVVIAEEQLVHFAVEADDARLRSLVSETAMADEEHRDAHRHVDAMRRHRDDVVGRIAELEKNQDSLLDKLSQS